MISTAMQVERQKDLRPSRYERGPERTGQANGSKPKTVKTRLGAITFDVPQVREGGFYPEALEKGLRRSGIQVCTTPRQACAASQRAISPEDGLVHRKVFLNTRRKNHWVG
jgi:hypothetical protein